jgi:hypothetical protein
MDGTTQDQSARPHRSNPAGSLEGMVIGAVDPAAVDAVRAALQEAGIPGDQIDVVTGNDLDDLHLPIDRAGFAGLVNRFLFSLGDELDELELARQELMDGKVLIGVPARGMEAVHRAREVLRDHGARGITHFGRWTITSFE